MRLRKAMIVAMVGQQTQPEACRSGQGASQTSEAGQATHGEGSDPRTQRQGRAPAQPSHASESWHFGDVCSPGNESPAHDQRAGRRQTLHSLCLHSPGDRHTVCSGLLLPCAHMPLGLHVAVCAALCNGAVKCAHLCQPRLRVCGKAGCAAFAVFAGRDWRSTAVLNAWRRALRRLRHRTGTDSTRSM